MRNRQNNSIIYVMKLGLSTKVLDTQIQRRRAASSSYYLVPSCFFLAFAGRCFQSKFICIVHFNKARQFKVLQKP